MPHGPSYAHSLPGQPPEQWQLLEDHLRNVATLAAEFAEPFGSADWAQYINFALRTKYQDQGDPWRTLHLESRQGILLQQQSNSTYFNPRSRGFDVLNIA